MHPRGEDHLKEACGSQILIADLAQKGWWNQSHVGILCLGGQIYVFDSKQDDGFLELIDAHEGSGVSSSCFIVEHVQSGLGFCVIERKGSIHVATTRKSHAWVDASPIFLTIPRMLPRLSPRR